MDFRIERLSDGDLAAARRLSTAVGWNQTAADWRRLLALSPDTCFGGWVGDELVATSTLATYDGRVGWVGMVLVDEAHRRRGYGSAVFEAALDAGKEAGLEVVGLDATDAGRQVYDGYGFERVGGIDRWRGAVDLPTPEGVSTFDRAERVAGFDAARCGVDRTPLLDHLLGSDGVTGVRSVREGETVGYAVVRPGRTCPQVGPVVADTPEVAERLLGAVGARVTGPVVIDALDRDVSARVLERTGLDVSRRLHRMTHEGARPALDGDGVAAAAGFEWG